MRKRHHPPPQSLARQTKRNRHLCRCLNRSCGKMRHEMEFRGRAEYRLRKALLFRLVQETGRDVCFRCGRKIETADEMSLDHRFPWRSALNPEATYFDLDNIVLSHLKCNIGAARREQTHCIHGHEFTPANTYIRRNGKRLCRQCRREYMRGWMADKRAAVRGSR